MLNLVYGHLVGFVVILLAKVKKEKKTKVEFFFSLKWYEIPYIPVKIGTVAIKAVCREVRG